MYTLLNLQQQQADWNIIDKFHIEGVQGNDNNEKFCRHLSPFTEYNNKLYIMKEWFERRKHIYEKHMSNIPYKIVDILPYKINVGNLYKQFEKIHLKQYQYRADMEALNYNVKFIEVQTVELLNTLTQIYVSSENVKDTIEIYINDVWVNGLKNVINYYNQNCFIRCERVSSKNDLGKNVITNVYDALYNLGKSKDVLKSLSELDEPMTYIAVMNWNPNITLDKEFRIFILDGQVRAISQQKWYIYIGIQREEMRRIAPLLFNAAIKINSSRNYIDACIDVWIDDKDDVHLIEINPGGRWSCSSSLLFSWSEKLWDENCEIICRYKIGDIDTVD